MVLCVILGFGMPALAQNEPDFDSWFVDKTLRLDYNFSGNAKEQHIAVDELKQLPEWHGKRHRLAELPVQGNGQITVMDHATGKEIYRNSFSTLFQEWLSYPEAQTTTKSFENVFLVPMPKDTVDIRVDLRNNRLEVMATMTHMVSPTDILIRHLGDRGVTPYETLSKAADTSNCIHIAFVAEGYTKDEMNIFLKDARAAEDAIFSYEPFKSLKDRFNIVAVECVSEESGTSEPGNGIWKRTALSSHFDTFYSDRYLTTLNLKDLHDCLAGVPYEHIIVLVNTEKYGGGGILNSYNLSMTHHKMFRPVVAHEFGHSFAGLADEYAYEAEAIPMYPHDVEPWERNITTKVNFKGKWEDLIGKDTEAGFYEGAGYSLKGVWRGYEDCRMRTNTNPEFCPVCRRAITDVIDFYTAWK
ncbi:MAG: M64 family metallopeptidase [Bacteroidales bacterium]|nr:M64 family metallopeptidase [Bacteroidales bacterium]MDY6001487.1 M64 family metallopeptidase [Candidatus Cryptobacteroides sp.]